MREGSMFLIYIGINNLNIACVGHGDFSGKYMCPSYTSKEE